MGDDCLQFDVDQVLYCLGCEEPVIVAIVDSEPVYTCQCGKELACEKMNPETVDMNPVTPDAWGYVDLDECNSEPSDLEKIRSIPNCKVREICSNCGYEETFRSVDRLEELYATHAELDENDCSEEDIEYQAICPRHGRIPLEYGYCDECRDNQRIMNDL